MSSPILGEFAGTFILILLGDGVVAGVLLKHSNWRVLQTGRRPAQMRLPLRRRHHG